MPESTSIRCVSLVLPAFNEVRSIAATLTEMRDYFAAKPYAYEIIVAADGNDGTRELVREMARSLPQLSVIGGPERRGKGRGVRQGVQLSRGDVVGFADADNKTPIGEFDKFEPLLASGIEVVIGSRKHRDSQIDRPQKLYRQLGSRAFRFGMRALVGLRDIADTQCGFKFFRREAADFIFAAQRVDGYMFDVELLYLASLAGYRIAEVPVRWRDDGDSRLPLVSGMSRNLMDLVKVRFGRYPHPAVRPGPDPGVNRG